MSKPQQHTFDQSFITESGECITKPTVAYQTWGTLNAKRDNVILVCHALTGDPAADEWFNGLFGAGNTLDPQRYFIICTNALGSCYGTSGPLSINPKTGKKYGADFPAVTIRDIVRLQQQLIDVLDIQHIQLIIGGSMGGMQALEWCVMDERPQSAVLIGMGKNHSPWAVGISHAQRQAIYNDPNWNDGHYSKDAPPRQGLSVARMIAMNSYRSSANYVQKFDRRRQKDGGKQFQVESYLNYQGQKLADRFDAVSYVRLTEAMDSHNVQHNRSEHVLSSVDIPVLVIGIDSDNLYPVLEQHELAQRLANGRYRELESPYGHDAFLIEFEKLNHIITPFLTETPLSIAAY